LNIIFRNDFLNFSFCFILSSPFKTEKTKGRKEDNIIISLGSKIRKTIEFLSGRRSNTPVRDYELFGLEFYTYDGYPHFRPKNPNAFHALPADSEELLNI